MPSSLSWKKAYASDKETSLRLHHLLHRQPFAKNTLSSLPIDDTDILRSIVAIGREFRFPIDINLSALPQLT